MKRYYRINIPNEGTFKFILDEHLLVFEGPHNNKPHDQRTLFRRGDIMIRSVSSPEICTDHEVRYLRFYIGGSSVNPKDGFKVKTDVYTSERYNKIKKSLDYAFNDLINNEIINKINIL